MEDEAEVRSVAAEYVQRWGVERAVNYFLDEAMSATARGDTFSAETWRDLAEAARRLSD